LFCNFLQTTGSSFNFWSENQSQFQSSFFLTKDPTGIRLLSVAVCLTLLKNVSCFYFQFQFHKTNTNANLVTKKKC
jgi:hypothetical protein